MIPRRGRPPAGGLYSERRGLHSCVRNEMKRTAMQNTVARAEG